MARPLIPLALSLMLAASPMQGSDALDLEEARVPAAFRAMGSALSPAKHHTELLVESLDRATTDADRVSAAQAAGQELWRSARERVQEGRQLDDRQLYWGRLAAKRTFREQCRNPKTCDPALSAFESASRGLAELTFQKQTEVRIVISGFDPFLLDEDIRQSNPSGVAALRLDDSVLHVEGGSAEIQAVVMPVRYADFDAGMVEAIFEPLIVSKAIHMLVTISMGRSQFDLERFPGRRRSATAPDNLNVYSGASSDKPLVPRLGAELLPGPEFVEFSLPARAMQNREGWYQVNDNRTVTSIERGEFQAASLQELLSQTAVRGGGGGYLSNEISFRTVRLVRAHDSSIIVGHIHTPSISGYEPEKLREITEQIIRMLKAAVATIST